jgi:hypothetical protein
VESTLRVVGTQIVLVLYELSSPTCTSTTPSPRHAQAIARAEAYIRRQNARFPLVYATLELGHSWRQLVLRLLGLDEDGEDGDGEDVDGGEEGDLEMGIINSSGGLGIRRGEFGQPVCAPNNDALT